ACSALTVQKREELYPSSSFGLPTLAASSVELLILEVFQFGTQANKFVLAADLELCLVAVIV
ncbi:hypothetical protein N9Z13_07950, partial [Luminiphilus sp.]|nr:hypothetical protein [Luminiphilus sp.]